MSWNHHAWHPIVDQYAWHPIVVTWLSFTFCFILPHLLGLVVFETIFPTCQNYGSTCWHIISAICFPFPACSWCNYHRLSHNATYVCFVSALMPQNHVLNLLPVTCGFKRLDNRFRLKKSDYKNNQSYLGDILWCNHH